MTNSRDSKFNGGQASRIRCYADEILAAHERLDEWFYNFEAEEEIDGWDRSVLRRLNNSSLLKTRDGVERDQKQWKVPEAVLNYIEDKGYD